MAVKGFGPLIFGFDIGIASVGWCVLGESRIVDLGVRCFDKAETAEKGESLNLVRRVARLMRRRLRRRAWRLTKLARLLKRAGLITDLQQLRQPLAISPWHLRVAGLDRLLSHEEWARVIYHLCKHRGFHWNSRAEEKKAEDDSKGEGGRVKKGLADTQQWMSEKSYRSAAEMVLEEFPESQRNKQGDYSKALSRKLLGEELGLLFKRQKELGNSLASHELQIAIVGNGDRKSGLFWEQKPPLAGADLLKMLGKCTFEKAEYRAPKASFSAERHVWLTRLNNLRIVVDGATRSLNDEERRTALPLPYKQVGDFTYKQLRAALTKAGQLPNNFKFVGLNYPYGTKAEETKTKDPELDWLVKLSAWQKLRNTLKDKNLETEWESIAGAAGCGDPTLLDEIARVLSIYKDGDEVAAELRKLALPGGEKMIEALSEVSFDKFHALSLKALRKIVPLMEGGLRYDQACAKVGYHHSQLHEPGRGSQTYLPPLYSGRDKYGRMVFSEDLDVPRNPVVLRALNQARKVLNALVRTYGSPKAVHIEMARDLSRPLDERNKIKKAQDEYRERNEKDKEAFAQEFKIPAKSREFEKFQLYREQQAKCAYSLRPFEVDRVLSDTGYSEVDHVLPYSRSYDNSKNNKVLVHAKENREKGNRTAYEYLTSFPGGENGERWQNYVAFVETNRSYRLAKRTRLLRKDFGVKAAEEFRERNLNDTRYICRFFKNYVESHLKLSDGTDGTTAKRCVVLNGQTTAFLRTRWGLLKARSDSDRHHALDAAVVAACSHRMIKRLGDYARNKELSKVNNGFQDPETGEIIDVVKFKQLQAHFPAPWPHFSAELKARLQLDEKAELHRQLAAFGTYSDRDLDASRPLFVSRAPQRRSGGAVHMDTIYGKPRRGHVLMVEIRERNRKLRRRATTQEIEGMVIERVGMFATADKGKKFRLTTDRLADIVGFERNARMVHALGLWLAARGDSPKQPGTREFPRKPRNGDPENGPFTGPEIKAIKLNGGKMSGIEVRGGIAQNERLIRLDAFRKDRRYFLVPLYVFHRVARELPIKTADGSISVDESYEFLFSIYQNDLVEVRSGDGPVIRGYFRSYGGPPNPSNITLALHDRSAKGHPRANSKGEITSIGVRTALSLIKLNVDVLGNIYPAPREERRGLA